MKRLIILIVFSFAIILSCNTNDDENINQQCKEVIIDNEQYKNAQSDSFEITNISSKKNCLNITLRYGGGCGDVIAKLVDSGDILESDPSQRNLRIAFLDNDECEALIQKDFLFDISDLELQDENRIRLNFKDTDLTYLYEY